MALTVRVDLFTQDPSTDEFVLYLVEDGPWPEDGAEWEPCLKPIQDRILGAVDAVTAGLVAGRFPESVGKKIRVQVDSPSGCPPELEELLAAADELLKTDPSYVRAIAASKNPAGIRIVSGKQMGRFQSG